MMASSGSAGLVNKTMIAIAALLCAATFAANHQDGGTLLLGYVPRFYSADLRTILGRTDGASAAEFRILRNNVDAPLQFRMLCRFRRWFPQIFGIRRC
jgi:hypothetical protein